MTGLEFLAIGVSILSIQIQHYAATLSVNSVAERSAASSVGPLMLIGMIVLAAELVLPNGHAL
jgi:hypothetical protein